MKILRLLVICFLSLIIFISCSNTVEYKLIVNIKGQGKVYPKTGNFKNNCIVILEIEPENGWYFSSWQGDGLNGLIKKDDDWFILMEEDKEITAVFEELCYNLSLPVLGEGVIFQSVINSTELADEFQNPIIELKAIPADGWEFVEWFGDIGEQELSNTVIRIILDKDSEIGATFIETMVNSRIYGDVSIVHLWPNPHKVKTGDIPKPRNGLMKFTIFKQAIDWLAAQNKEKFIPGELIIGFKEGKMTNEEEVKIINELGYKIKNDLRIAHAYVVEVSAAVDEVGIKNEINKFAERVRNVTPYLSYIEPNYCYFPGAIKNNEKIPDDEYFKWQWNLLQTRLPQAWSVTTGASSVRIAILDSGIASNHPDLLTNINFNEGRNFTGGNIYDLQDYYGHGTICSGVISANTNNKKGVSGVMWNVDLIPLKIADTRVSTSAEKIAEAIYYAIGLEAPGILGSKIDKAVDFISISYSCGINDYSNIIDIAIKKAYDMGILTFFCTMNDNQYIKPLYESAIYVGATDYNYPNAPNRAYYSNYGLGISLVAPGGDYRIDTENTGNGDGVLSTAYLKGNPDDYGYAYNRGTSLAAPHVAGIAGLMIANGVPADEIEEALYRTAIDLGAPGYDIEFGHGLANAYWAVNNVKYIKILVGTKKGDKIDAVAQGKIDLKAHSYSLSNIPNGVFQVFAWIDVQNTSTIDTGDYFFESLPVQFNGAEQKVDLILNETQGFLSTN